MAALVPNDGYWHSSPFSIQLHQCLFEDACKFEIPAPGGVGNATTRIESLDRFYSNLELEEVEKAREEMRVYSNAEYQQCREASVSIVKPMPVMQHLFEQHGYRPTSAMHKHKYKCNSNY